ncbi:MAG: hypothetical protein ACJ790_06545 [Myxococcaceae bacterium]
MASSTDWMPKRLRSVPLMIHVVAGASLADSAVREAVATTGSLSRASRSAESAALVDGVEG